MKNEMRSGLGDPSSREIEGAPGSVRGETPDAFQHVKSGEAVEVAQTSPLLRYMIPQKGDPFKTDPPGLPSKSQPNAPKILFVPDHPGCLGHPLEKTRP